MKNGILNFIIGVLVGAIITAGVFLYYNKSISKNTEQFNMPPQMQGENFKRQRKSLKNDTTNSSNETNSEETEIPDFAEGEEPPEMPDFENEEEPPAKPDGEKMKKGQPKTETTQNDANI